MGLGIIPFLKSIAPWTVFIAGIVFALRALTGKTEWPLMFLITLLPLRNIIDKLHSLPVGKDFIDILLVMLIVGWIIRAMKKGEKFFERSSVNWIAIFLIIYTFFSLLKGAAALHHFTIFNLSDVRVHAWKNFCMLPMLFFLTFNTIKEKKWIWRTVLVMCATMAFMNFYLVRQIADFSSLVSRDKIRGTFVYLGPNEVAAFYNQYTILLMAIYFFMKKSLAKSMLLVLIMTNLYCVLFLFSRAGYLALATGMFFLFMIKNKKLLIVLILAGIFWQIALPDKVKERIEMTTNDYGELDTSSQKRLVVWEDSIRLFQAHPITGVGYGVFYHLGFELGDTHNIYLKILAEQGILGIAIFLILLFIFFIQGIKLFLGGDDPLSKGMGLGFAMCIIVLLVNNMFGDRWSYVQLSSNLWVFAALVARLNIISAKTKQEQSGQRRKQRRETINDGFSA